MTEWMESLVAEVTARLAVYKDIKEMNPEQFSQLIQETAHKTDNKEIVQGLLNKLKERLEWELTNTPKELKALNAFKELALIGAARGNLSTQDQKTLQTSIDEAKLPSGIKTPMFHEMVINTLKSITNLTEAQEHIDYGEKVIDLLAKKKEAESPLQIAARTGNTGGLDLLIRETRPWETKGEMARLKSIAQQKITNPTEKGKFIKTFEALCMKYERESVLEQLKTCSDQKLMLGVLKGCSEGLRNDKEFILEVIRIAPKGYAAVVSALGNTLGNKEFIQEMTATLAATIKKNAELRQKKTK